MSAPSATPGQLQSPALGSPNPWDEANHMRGLPVLQKLHVGETRPLSPAMQSVLLLTALYYLLYMVPIVERLASRGLSCCAREEVDDCGRTERGESTAPPTVLQRIRKNAENAMQLIPMLSILILFARLRSRVDLEGSSPPPYAQSVFYASAVIVYAIALFQDIFFCGGPRMQWFKRTLSFLLVLGLIVCVGVIFQTVITGSKSPE
eukprot:g1131.t1